MSAQLDCPRIDYWPALLDETLLPAEREALERHLESCRVCQERIDVTQVGQDRLQMLGRQFGDPTIASTDPVLAQVCERLHEVRSPIRVPQSEPADLSFLTPASEPDILGRLGSYEVREIIGQGGMGIVLKAFDPALNRIVAIKVMAPLLASNAHARRRFTREAKAAAAITHDHVVAVHGVHAEGHLPYLVMQYIAGESLQNRLDRHGPLDVEEIIRIGMQTAQGLAAAHAQGLIHRDIKPANLLLGMGNSGMGNGEFGMGNERMASPHSPFPIPHSPFPNSPFPIPHSPFEMVKVTDFGLARMVDDVGLTQHGVVAGTPEYMAPEQARAEPVDHRSDLFSLGSVLYAMCTGMPPFRGDSSLAVLRCVSDEEPEPVRSVNPKVPEWLAALIDRLMAKDPAQRYQSAAEVARLLAAGAPADGAPPPHRSSIRSPSWTGMILGAIFLVSLGLVALGLTSLWISLAAAAAADTSDRPTISPLTANVFVWSIAISHDGKFVAAGAGKWDEPGEIGVWDLATQQPLQRFTEEIGIASVVLSPNDKLLASGSWSGHVRVYDWAAGKQLYDLPVVDVARVAFSPDGRLLATVTEGATALLWDMTTGKLAAELDGDLFRFHCVTFSPDGKYVLAGGGDWKFNGLNQVTVWDVESRKQVMKLVGHQNAILSICYSPDGRTIATGAVDNTVRLWDAGSGNLIRTLRGHNGWIEGVTFTSDGKTLVSGSIDRTVRFWDVDKGTEKKRLAMNCEVRCVRYTPDGNSFLASGGLKTLKMFSATDQQEQAAFWNGSIKQKAPMDDFPITYPATIRGTTGWAAAGLFGFGLIFLLSLMCAVGLMVHRSRVAPSSAVGEHGSSPLAFSCTACGKKLKAQPELAGKRIKCPHCSQPTSVPENAPEQALLSPAPQRSKRGTILLAWSVCALIGGVLLLMLFWLPREIEQPAGSQLKILVERVNAGRIDTIDARRYPTLTDKDLVVLQGLTNLKHLNLDHTGITDEGLKSVAGATNLVDLSLTNTQVTDAGIAQLVTLTNLEELRLDRLPITDSTLARVSAFPRLKKLSLYQTGVTDDGLVHLKQLTQLQHLSLDDTQTGDAGLRHLSACANLQYLSVWKTRVTPAGLQELRRALPRLKVNK